MIFGQLVSEGRKNKQLSLRELSGLVDTSPATLCKVESCQHIPRNNVIEGLVKHLNLDSDKVWEAVGKQKAAPYHSGLTEFPGQPEFSPVPIVGQVTAGSMIEAPDWTDGGFPTGSGFDTEMVPLRQDEAGLYGLTVSGDSMEPVFANGDYVFAAPGKQPRNNGFAVIRLVSGEVFLKRIIMNDNLIILQSANPAYKTITVEKKNVLFIHPITIHRLAG